jgi:hypothetical protein
VPRKEIPRAGAAGEEGAARSGVGQGEGDGTATSGGDRNQVEPPPNSIYGPGLGLLVDTRSPGCVSSASSIGSLNCAAIGTIGLGRNSVSSRSRVPRSPHRMKTGTFDTSGFNAGASLESGMHV